MTEGNQQGTPKQTWLTGRLHAPKGWYTLRSCSCFHHPNVCTNWPSGNNRRIRWEHCKQYITTNMHGFSLIMIHNVSYVCLPSNFLSTSWCAMMKLHGMKGTPSSHHREWYSWNHNGYINPYAWGLWHMVNHGKPNHINLPTPGSYSSTVGAVPVACECARPLQTHTCRKIRGVGDDMDVSRSSTKKMLSWACTGTWRQLRSLLKCRFCGPSATAFFAHNSNDAIAIVAVREPSTNQDETV